MAKDIGDYSKCQSGCNYEGHCFTIWRFDEMVLVCPECFWDYIPEYHQVGLTRVALRRLQMAAAKREYEDKANGN